MKILCQETVYVPDEAGRTFNPSAPGGKRRWISELVVSVGYKVSYRTAKTTLSLGKKERKETIDSRLVIASRDGSFE